MSSSTKPRKILASPHAIYVAKQRAAKKLAKKIEKRAAKQEGGRGRGRGRGRGQGRGRGKGRGRNRERAGGRGIGGPCYAFQRGECTRGVECHFSHDGTNNPGKRPQPKPSLRKRLENEEKEKSSTNSVHEAAMEEKSLSKKRENEKRWLEKQKQMRDGDWLCDSCGAHNFASRSECFKCNIGKDVKPTKSPKPQKSQSSGSQAKEVESRSAKGISDNHPTTKKRKLRTESSPQSDHDSDGDEEPDDSDSDSDSSDSDSDSDEPKDSPSPIKPSVPQPRTQPSSQKIKLCIDFKKGICKRGAACKFAHQGTTAVVEADGTVKRVGQATQAKAPLDPKTVEVNNEIALCGQRKQLREAKKIFDIAVRKGLANVYTYSIFLNVLVNGGDMDQALQLFEEMRKQFPTRGIGVVAFTSLIKGLCTQGQLFKALLVYDSMKKMPRKGGAKKKQRSSSNSNGAPGAHQWICTPNLRTVNTLLRGCLISGDVKAAIEIFTDMKSIPRCAPDSSTYDYFSSLLSQGLLYRELTSLKATIAQNTAAVPNTPERELPEVLMAMARAAYLLGYDGAAKKFLVQARQQLQKAIANDSYGGHGGQTASTAQSSTDNFRKPLAIAEGGRRAGTQSRADDERRQESNRIFRRHRASELLRAVHALDRFMARDESSEGSASQDEEASQNTNTAAKSQCPKLKHVYDTLEKMLSPQKDSSTAKHPNLLPYFLRFFSTASPVVSSVTAAHRSNVKQQLVAHARHRLSKDNKESKAAIASQEDSRSETKKKKRRPNIAVPLANVLESLDVQQRREASQADKFCQHLASAVVNRFGLVEYLRAWGRTRSDVLSPNAAPHKEQQTIDPVPNVSSPDNSVPVAELRSKVKEHNDAWKKWLASTEAGKVAKTKSRKKRSVDPKNYSWDPLNEFLHTIGLGHDASANPNLKDDAVSPKKKRAKSEKSPASSAQGAKSSKILLKEWCSNGQAAVQEFFKSILVNEEGIVEPRRSTPRGYRGRLRRTAFLDLNKVLDITNELISSQTPTTERRWRLEIGSGSGEWAAKQALADPSSGWATLELRHDRAYRSWMHTVMQNIPNLCVLAGSVFDIVPDHIPNKFFERVFVNHPEPPQQQGGVEGDSSDEDESGSCSVDADHMLNTSFFVEIQRILSVGGTVTVLTDNEWYGSFLANQLDGFLDSDHCLLESVELECGAGDETPEVSSVADLPESDREIRSRKVADQVGGVTLYEGEPGSNCGYQQSISGQSYFDRLWSRGVSRHADQSRRWFVCLRRLSEHKAPVRESTLAVSQTALNADVQQKKKAAKQAAKQQPAVDRSDQVVRGSSEEDSDIDDLDDGDLDVATLDFSSVGGASIDLQALERKIQQIEQTEADEKAKFTENVQAQLESQRTTTAGAKQPTSQVKDTKPKQTSKKQQQTKPAQSSSEVNGTSFDTLVKTVKKNNNAWKSWLRSSGNRSSAGADPKKYSPQILQAFVDQL